jgi:predicted dehydrogenase
MTIRRIKILGAGSIGNHLANAAIGMGWETHICDVDANALVRMRQDIYPTRYGSWDDRIQQHLVREAPKGGFDLICVGTPPDTHLEIAIDALTERPKALQIEKPLCTPSLDRCDALVAAVAESGARCFVGYDHAVGKSMRFAIDVIKSGDLGEIITCDVQFREHWSGIFKAHPWLSGPSDSYLGYWRRGGGASGEHSHALHLWQYIVTCAGAGRLAEMSATLGYRQSGKADYDELCLMQLRTETGFVGRVVQDVVSSPPSKTAWVQGAKGSLTWTNGFAAGKDAVAITYQNGAEPILREFEKTRADDFIEEMRHIQAALEDGQPSPISLESGLDTMLAIAAAHWSDQSKRRVRINYDRGYNIDALEDA